MLPRHYFRSPSFQILAGTLTSSVLSFGSVWLLGTSTNEISTARGAAIIAAFFLSYLAPTFILVLMLYRSFQKTQPPAARLRLILLSYICMILVFTGVYFSMAFIGDHEYSVDHYFYYQSAADSLASGGIKRINPYPTSSRAFLGIEERLWGTVDDYMPRGIYQGLEDVERYRARWASQLAFEGVVSFKSRSVPSVLSDCLHLSIITITTVGYGNISPRTWYAKRAADVEALTGTMLLVVALGTLLSGFGTKGSS